MSGTPAVVDASVIVHLLLALPGSGRLAGRLARASTLHAPHLLDLEVMSAVRTVLHRGVVPGAVSDRAVRELGELGVHRYPHAPLRARVWELRHAVTPYDAAYLALAEALRAPLLTLDGRLAASHGHDARVEVLGGSAGV